MDINLILNDYALVKHCSYKDELYSVRENGAIFRHAREGKRIRKDDNIWTFGKPDKKTGYMNIGSERVHRIVAFAFLGEPPTSQHVVDHIDTNRRNNRVNNLRWLTKLENALKNPITRSRIEYQCGSIENFINDPSLIRKFANNNPSYEWMRAVTKEEAIATYNNLCALSENTIGETSKNRPTTSIGEYIYTPQKFSKTNAEQKYSNRSNYKPFNLTESLTPNALQKNWRTPTEFPLCPNNAEDDPLSNYFNNLKIGAIVTQNKHAKHYIDEFILCNNRIIIISHSSNDDDTKRFAIVFITFDAGKYIHEGKSFFEMRGAKKSYTLAQGLKWYGDAGIDDYC